MIYLGSHRIVRGQRFVNRLAADGAHALHCQDPFSVLLECRPMRSVMIGTSVHLCHKTSGVLKEASARQPMPPQWKSIVWISPAIILAHAFVLLCANFFIKHFSLKTFESFAVKVPDPVEREAHIDCYLFEAFKVTVAECEQVHVNLFREC